MQWEFLECNHRLWGNKIRMCYQFIKVGNSYQVVSKGLLIKHVSSEYTD